MPQEQTKSRKQERSPEQEYTGPITYLIGKWYGYVFAAMYILYGGVKIILGVLDRNYEDFGSALIFLALGIIIVAVATGYRETKKWGWTGMVAVVGLVILWSLFDIGNELNWIILALSLVSLGALLAGSTREYIETER